MDAAPTKTKTSEPPDTLVVSFKTAIKLADNSYSSITLSEPTARQMEAAHDPNPITSNILLIAENAGVPVEVVRDMKKRDLEKALTYLTSFS